MNRAGYLDDPCLRPEGGSQMVGEHEVTEVIHSEVDLETIRGDAPCCSDSGIVDEDVEWTAGGPERAGSLSG